MEKTSPIDLFGDAFVTLVYGSTVSIIISYAIEPGQGAILALFMVLFVLSDWISRIWLPWRLPAEDRSHRHQIKSQFYKVILEVSSVFFIAIACASLIKPPNGTPSPLKFSISADMAFGYFLIVSYCWNIYILNVMQKLKFWELFHHGFRGTVLNLESTKFYTKDFFDFINKINDEIRENNFNSKKDIYKILPKLLGNSIIISIGRITSQLLAMHITWANLIGGLILIILTFWEVETILIYIYEFIGLTITWTQTLSLIALTTLSLLLVSVVSEFASINDKVKLEKLCNIFTGTSLQISLLILYCSLEARDLLYLMAAQQVCVNIFLQFSFSKPTPDETIPATQIDKVGS